MRLYLVLFVATGIPFGLMFADARIGLLAGLLFGAMMSLSLGTLASVSLKLSPYGTLPNATGVHQVRHVAPAVPYDRAFDLGIEPVGVVPKCAVREADRISGRIVARAGTTWKTFGDIISFEVLRNAGEGTSVKVSSRPAIVTTLVDYGKNLENVEGIAHFLRDRAEKRDLG